MLNAPSTVAPEAANVATKAAIAEAKMSIKTIQDEPSKSLREGLAERHQQDVHGDNREYRPHITGDHGAKFRV